MLNRFLTIVALVVLVTVACAHTTRAQGPVPNSTATPTAQPAALSAKALEMRKKVEKISVGGRITIIRFDGIEHYGTVRKLNFDSVEIAEVDIKQVVVDSYSDVKKVRKGYGGLNLLSGKRPNPAWGLVAAAAIFVPLVIALTQLE